MQIRFLEIEDEPFAWHQTLAIPAEQLDRQEVLDLGPVKWQGQMSRTTPGFYLAAELSCQQTLRCDRCLDAVIRPVHADVALWVLNEEPPDGEEVERQLDESDLGMVYQPGEVFDTRPLVDEQLQLSIPLKPLCSADCKGICPQCGANRNKVDCECGESAPDPRWSALAALKDRLDDEPTQ